jgi:glyoxylase-like metal-dependent hydrolase (beta-lactamase superfamily II)
MRPREAAPARVRTLTVGDFRITSIPDGHIQLHPAGWYGRPELPRPAPEVLPLLDNDGYLVASVGSLVIEAGDQVIALDTGLGPVTVSGERGHPAIGRMSGGALPGEWRAAGVPEPTQVVITHMHEDHTGWWSSDHPFGARLRELPTTVGRADLERSPLADLSQYWQPADGGEQVGPGVTVIALPGHTPGHLGLRIESQGETLIAFGDALHSTLQVADPTINAFVEHDPAAAIATRTALLEDLRRVGTLAYGNHFADVVFGRLGGQQWQPIEQPGN